MRTSEPQLKSILFRGTVYRIRGPFPRFIKEREKLTDGLPPHLDAVVGNQGLSFIELRDYPVLWPLADRRARVTSRFLPSRTIENKTRPHKGIDFGVPVGTPVLAAGDGIVATNQFDDDGWGNYLTVTHPSGYTSLYAHLSVPSDLVKGTPVRQGDMLGYSGASGRATGPHLHFEIMKGKTRLDPLSFLISVDPL